MKGVSYVTDESNKKLAVQIDIKLLENLMMIWKI